MKEGNVAMQFDALEYRQRAACLMLAAEAQDVFPKRRFEALAQSWIKLAADLEMAKAVAWGAAVERWRGSTSRRGSTTTYWESRADTRRAVNNFRRA